MSNFFLISSNLIICERIHAKIIFLIFLKSLLIFFLCQSSEHDYWLSVSLAIRSQKMHWFP